MRSFVLVTCIAACGRIGFAPAGTGGDDDVLGDGGVPGNEIGLSVVTDGDGGNSPIQNAVVLIDRGDGTLERVATSDTGVAVFGATVPTRIVVVYSDAANSWHVTDLDAVPPGTVVHFGARPSTYANQEITMTLPAVAGNTQYRVAMPARCGYSPNTSGTAVGALYMPQCEGQSVHVIGEALTNPIRAFDAGHVTLTEHGATTLTGTYMTGQTYTVDISNVPAAAAAGGGAINGGLALLDPDLGMIELGEFNTQLASSSTATVMPQAEPFANAFVLEIYGGGLTSYEWVTQTVAVRAISSTMSADARELLPIITTLSLSPNANAASWTLAPATSVAPAIYAYEANIVVGARFVRWAAYRATATTLQFPNLPPDLADADPAGGAWTDATIIGLAFPGATYNALIPTVDRDWHSWGSLISSDNFSYTENLYSSGLGPP